MRLFVIDVSVAAKWVLPREHEPLVDMALRFLQTSPAEFQFLAPDLFWAELGSVLWKCVRTSRWSDQDALTALADFPNSTVTIVANADLLPRALSIALTARQRVYDCLYIALAERAGCEMITADEHLVNALGSRFPVRWLGGMRF